MRMNLSCVCINKLKSLLVVLGLLKETKGRDDKKIKKNKRKKKCKKSKCKKWKGGECICRKK